MSKTSGNIIIPKGQVICGRSALRPNADVQPLLSGDISGHYIGKVDTVDLFVAADSSLCSV